MKFEINRLTAFAVLAMASIFGARPGFAATLPANPATIQAVLAKAKGGDTIVLAKAVYAEIGVYNHNPATGVTIDAHLATIRHMPFQYSSNFTLVGGAFGPSIYGTVTLFDSHDITVQGGAFTGAGTAAISISGSRRINVVGNTINGSLGDGVDIAASQYVLVQANACLGNIEGAFHPDCVQMWSIIGQPQVSHITITGNRARGNTQGFDLFDHGTGGGSFIDIDHNVVCTTFVWAGQVNAATNSTMVNNVAYTLPGAVVGWAPPTWLLTGGPTDTANLVESQGNVFNDNTNGVKPNTKGDYPPCPV